MSSSNPIIAVTGSSGAGTSTTTSAFEHIFRTLGINSVNVEGDSFHRFSRPEMDLEKRKAKETRSNISYFGDYVFKLQLARAHVDYPFDYLT